MVVTPQGGAVVSVAFSRDSRKLAVGRAESVEMLEAGTWKAMAGAAGHLATIEAVASSRDGSLLATGDERGEIRFWDARGRWLKTIQAGGAAIRQLAISPDGKRWRAKRGCGMWRAASFA